MTVDSPQTAKSLLPGALAAAPGHKEAKLRKADLKPRRNAGSSPSAPDEGLKMGLRQPTRARCEEPDDYCKAAPEDLRSVADVFEGRVDYYGSL